MKKKIKFCGSLILITICALTFAPRGLMQVQDAKMASAQVKEAPKLALLVGINNYTSPSIRDLNGTHNDVELMKNLLVEQYKFKEEKIKAAPNPANCGQQTATSPVKTLCSEQATQAAIIEAFEKHLIAGAENFQKQNNVSPDKGATIVFYYSGHGSTLPDEAGGDESDGVDETIVAADSDVYGAKDIRDDKFEELFGRLKKFTTNITFIFDSCHSGTVTRGSGVKSVERNFKSSSAASRGDSTNLSDAMDTDASYVTISGSLPNEKSQEDYFPVEKPKPGAAKDQLNGALTYYLVQNLRRNPDATYREIMNQVQTTVSNLKRGQTPQAEGAIDRVVFGSGAARQKTPIFVKNSATVKRTFDGKEQEVNEIQMDVGTIAGAQTGGVVAVYNSKARQMEGDQDKIATGSITFANAFASKADVVLTDKTLKNVPLDAKVVLVTPNFSDKRRKIALDFPGVARAAQADLMTRLADVLKNNELLETVQVNNLLPKLNAKTESAAVAAPDWDAAVVRGTYKDFTFGNAQADVKDAKIPADAEEIYFLTNRSGMPLYNFWVRAADENAVKIIRDALESHVRIENLRLLANTASKLTEQIQFELVRLKDYTVVDSSSTPPQCAITPDEQNRSTQFKSGEMFYVKMTNASDKNLFVYLYSIGTSGKINLLYPAQNAKETLKPNLLFTSVAAAGCYGIFQVGKPEDTPLGKETLKLIVSTQPFPAELLTSPAIAKATQRDGSALSKLLSQTTTNQRSGPIEISLSDWATQDINIEIVR